MRIGIIRGGIYGTAIAYFLEELDGSHDIHVFEKGSLAGASTGKSAGIVRHHYSSKTHIRFAKRGREILEELPDRIERDGGFHQNGYLIMAGEEHEAQFRRNVALQQEVGLDVELVEPDELSKYVPGIGSKRVQIAAIEHEAGFADPYSVAIGFADAARDRGTRIHTNTSVTDLETTGGTVTAVVSDGQRFPVDSVVNAAGPWADDVASFIGVDLPLTLHEAKVVTLSADRPYTPKVSNSLGHRHRPLRETRSQRGFHRGRDGTQRRTRRTRRAGGPRKGDQR